MVNSATLTTSIFKAMHNMFRPPIQRVTKRIHPLKQLGYRQLSCTAQVNKSFVIENHDDFINKVMNSDIPVIVNFHAEWCDPCKILSPKLMEIVDPMEDVNLAVVDVENNAELVHTFEVKAVPAVIAVRNGLVVDKFIGLVEADMIDKLIRNLTGKKKQG